MSEGKAKRHARIPDEHRLRLIDANIGSSGWCIMATLYSRADWSDDGRAKAWCPQGEIAKECNISTGAVKQGVQRLKAKGVLRVLESGHNGHATVYELCPPLPEGEAAALRFSAEARKQARRIRRRMQ